MISPAHHPLKKTLCFGDALIDMVTIETAKNIETPAIMQPLVGGAPANVAVGIAKLGAPAAFAGGVGSDAFGHQITDTLSYYNVDTALMHHSLHAPTGLAIVHLDKMGERSFTFYQAHSAFQDYSPEHLDDTKLTEFGYLHIVSNSLAQTNLEATAQKLIAQLPKHALVSFDINYRAAFWSDERDGINTITRFLPKAHIIKISQEELDWLEPDRNQQKAFIERLLNSPTTQLVLHTLGESGVHYYTTHGSGHVAGFPVTPIDTTGAGDSFMAGFLYQLAVFVINSNTLDGFAQSQNTAFTQILRFACACASITVAKSGAIPALPDLESVNQLLETSPS